MAIAAGGPAESNSGGGDYSFVADEDFVGGGDNIRGYGHHQSNPTRRQRGAHGCLSTRARRNLDLYDSGTHGRHTYTVLLHFAETYFTAAGGREFNVAINGTTVLTNFDIYATVGKDAALVEQFTATANSSGDIVIAFTDGTANQPLVMGIEIRTN